MSKRSPVALARPKRATLRTRAVLVYGVTFVALACTVEIINRRFLYPGTDGLFWEVLQAYHPHYGAWVSLEVSDPLQGMFDIFPQGYRGTLLLDALSVLPLDIRVNGALIHGMLAAFVVVSTYVMARGAGMTRRTAVLAAVLTPVLTLPGLLGSNGVVSQAFVTTPNYLYVISGTVLVIGLYWMVDGQLNARLILGWLFALLVTAEVCSSFPLHMTLLLPAVIIFGVGSLIASESARERHAKLGWAVAIAAGLAILGLPGYLNALGSNTAFHFFFDELNYFALHAIPANTNLKDDLFYVLQWRAEQPSGLPAAIISTLGLLSAVYFAISGEVSPLARLRLVFRRSCLRYVSHCFRFSFLVLFHRVRFQRSESIPHGLCALAVSRHLSSAPD